VPDLPEPPSITEVPEAPAPEGEKPKPVQAVLLSLVVIAAMVGVGVWLWRPLPCEAHDFRSNRFGYCVVAPRGWSSVSIGGTYPADQFLKPGGAATIIVRVIEVPEGLDLDSFADSLREGTQQAGLEVGELERAELGGVPALSWEATGATLAADAIRSRDLVAMHDGFAWRITLSDVPETYEQHLVEFREMLDSWVFR
jgi:hypothetical protein